MSNDKTTKATGSKTGTAQATVNARKVTYDANLRLVQQGVGTYPGGASESYQAGADAEVQRFLDEAQRIAPLLLDASGLADAKTRKGYGKVWVSIAPVPSKGAVKVTRQTRPAFVGDNRSDDAGDGVSVVFLAGGMRDQAGSPWTADEFYGHFWLHINAPYLASRGLLVVDPDSVNQRYHIAAAQDLARLGGFEATTGADSKSANVISRATEADRLTYQKERQGAIDVMALIDEEYDPAHALYNAYISLGRVIEVQLTAKQAEDKARKAAEAAERKASQAWYFLSAMHITGEGGVGLDGMVRKQTGIRFKLDTDGLLLLQDVIDQAARGGHTVQLHHADDAKTLFAPIAGKASDEQVKAAKAAKAAKAS